jgi:hydroxypyruvate isomerase
MKRHSVSHNRVSRRAALRRAGATLLTATVALRDRLAAAEAAGGGQLKGHINHSVCKWCYRNISLEDLCKAGKEMGLRSVELLEVKDFPTLKKYDLVCAMVSGVPGGIENGLNRVENHDKIAAFMEQTIPVVASAGFPNIICFSGNRKGLDDQKGIENCAAGIKKFIATAEKHKVNVCMELLNSRVNHKDYQCDHTEWGVELCKRVGSERFKLLYDIYHLQIMEGDIIRTIRDNHQYIAHYHTGGNPGRNEIDDTQELNYKAVMEAIAATGYTGYVGQEFIPTREPLEGLRQAVVLCDV